MKKHRELLKMVLSALFLAIAYVLPYLTGQIPEVGSMLCPMHIPVILCGFICGWHWGLIVGAIAPLFRSFLTGGYPPLMPTALCMAFELAAYGAFAGIVYTLLRRTLNGGVIKKWSAIYASLFVAMIVGRLVWGSAMFIYSGINGEVFGLKAFWAGAVANALPGILVQVVLIPPLVFAAERISFLRK